MKKRIISCGFILASAFFMFACGDKKVEKKEYVKESEIKKVFSNPEKYKGKYIKIGGKIFNTDSNDDGTALQIWYDVKNSKDDFLVTTTSEETFNNDEYVKIDGKIQGKFSGENAFGGEVTSPQISAQKIEKSTYKDVVAPEQKTKEVNISKKQHGVIYTVKKVEYAKDETRIYIEVKNNSKANVDVYSYSVKAVQDGKQIKEKENYEADYKKIESVSPGATDEGVLCFEKIDSEKSFTLRQEAYSDNYNITMKDFVIEIK